MALDSERHDRILKSLAGSDLDGIVSITASTVLLLSGYWPVVGHSVAVAARSGEVVVLVPEDELDLAEPTSAAHVIGYKPAALDRLTEPAKELRRPLAGILTALGLGKGRLGVELDATLQPATYVSSAIYRHELLNLLNSIAASASFVPCDRMVAELQATKTRTELQRIKTVCRITQVAYANAQGAVQAGATEPEVASAFQATFDTSRLARSVQRGYGTFFCMSGPNSATASAAYTRTRQRVIESGDLVMIHANTCGDGYWTDITRTYSAGEPTDRHQAMCAAILRARDAAVNAVRPGARASEVDRAARDVMQAHGFGEAFRHGTGHGVGFAAINANALPRIHPASPDVLEEGMTFNIEPAAYFDGYGGMRHCDMVAVTADGAQILTAF